MKQTVGHGLESVTVLYLVLFFFFLSRSLRRNRCPLAITPPRQACLVFLCLASLCALSWAVLEATVGGASIISYGFDTLCDLSSSLRAN